MNSYLQKTQKTVTVPSGAKVTVRRRTRGDDILIGAAPAFVVRGLRLKDQGKEIPDSTPQDDLDFAKYLAKQSEILLTRCVIGFSFDGADFTIVSKELGQEGAGEIPFTSITAEDEEAIIEAINSLATGRGSVDPFPKEAATSAGSGCAGDSIRVPSDGPTETHA